MKVAIGLQDVAVAEQCLQHAAPRQRIGGPQAAFEFVASFGQSVAEFGLALVEDPLSRLQLAAFGVDLGRFRFQEGHAFLQFDQRVARRGPLLFGGLDFLAHALDALVDGRLGERRHGRPRYQGRDGQGQGGPDCPPGGAVVGRRAGGLWL